MHILDKLTPVVLALGYFDCVHVGHREVIKRAKDVADKLKCKLVVFTFGGNLRAMTDGKEHKFVFTPKEREELILSLGADEIYFAPASKEFLSLSKEEFLDKINDLYNIKCYVSGSDYRFGKGASGNIADITEYASVHSQKTIVVSYVVREGERVSTTSIKKLLSEGKIERANVLLGAQYFVTGKVVRDRGVGRKLGYPTANLDLCEERQPLAYGVYSGRVKVDNGEYRAVINYGSRPTFNVNKVVLEAHLLDFEGDIYGKEITVSFDKFIRGIVTFSSEEELKAQLKKDIKTVEETYD